MIETIREFGVPLISFIEYVQNVLASRRCLDEEHIIHLYINRRIIRCRNPIADRVQGPLHYHLSRQYYLAQTVNHGVQTVLDLKRNTLIMEKSMDKKIWLKTAAELNFLAVASGK